MISNTLFSIFFSIILRVSETSYLRSLRFEDFSNQTEFNQAIVDNSIFNSYKNCLWLVVMTMTNIGYGEIVVKAFFSRICIFFISVSGTVLISFTIVDLMEYFNMKLSEEKTYQFFSALELKEEMKFHYNEALRYFLLTVVR